MAKKPSYAEALKILGQDDSTVLDFAEKLVDGGLGAAGVPDLFGMRGEIVTKGRELLTTIRERITGVSRWDRTQRIDAAYLILLTVSVLEALDELGYSEHVSVERALRQTVPYRDMPETSALGTSGDVAATLSWMVTVAMSSYDHDEHLDSVLTVAKDRFEESYRQLAADVPEFGVWLNLSEHERTRAELATGLTDLEEQLTRLSPQHQAHQHVRELHTLYRQPLWRPVLSSTDAPDHITVPALEQIYINPRARAASASMESRPASEDWWAEESTSHNDVPTLLTRCLTQVWAATQPIVILGHPGAGKSKLTEMLAARLPADDFLTIRVELRAVNADAPTRRQVEQAVSDQLHRDVAWRDLVDSAPGALPVVILDGFDELLQATGLTSSPP